MTKPPAKTTDDAETVIPVRRRLIPTLRESRYAYDVPVSLTMAGETVNARVREVWAGGAFVACDPPPAMDDVLAFELPTPRGAIPVRARVVWVRQARGLVPDPGAGLQFEDLDRGVDAVLADLVDRLAGKGGHPR